MIHKSLKNLTQIEHYRHRSWVKFLANFFVGLIAYTLCTNLLAHPVHAQPEQARSASDFVDSIGLTTHLNPNYESTPYGNYDGIIKPRLQELGIRHIRDGGYNSTFNQKLNDLATIGVRSTLVMAPADGTFPSDAVTIAKSVSNSIEAVEGPNETDLPKYNFSYNGQVFPEGTRAYQNDLYAAIKGDEATESLPVLMPSMGWAKNAETLGALSSGDMGNMHSYPALGNPPTHDIDWWHIPFARIIAGNDKPLQATETGYHNNVDSESGISELASSKYLPRLYLENFNRNIRRTFITELIDKLPKPDKSDENQPYGLLRYDGSQKPAYQSIKNLITLLKEPGANFSPGSLDYTLGGDTTDVHHTLLQKSNGAFYLVLWQQVKSWDNSNKNDIFVADRELTLTVNTVLSKATAYSPISSTSPIEQYTDPKQLTLTIPDHPLVIELVPA